ncbi:WD repeat-containing protein 97 [Scyliorhinus canicula]|uniref:WD repeat-containing protein 97 n=1 Tax=Scyliorhinus canicula TaxID=7830 RepID=UPI0018F2E019|nr:WD repeat-containing protein 97 [Scyliorhinus canicula]
MEDADPGAKTRCSSLFKMSGAQLFGWVWGFDEGITRSWEKDVAGRQDIEGVLAITHQSLDTMNNGAMGFIEAPEHFSTLVKSQMMLKRSTSQEDTQKKAHRMWNVLKTVVHISSEKIRRHDWKPLHLEHGIEHVQRMMFKKAIHYVLYNITTQETICMTSEIAICIYHPDGRKKQELTLQEPIQGLVYAQQINQYVAWSFCPQLKVLSHDFQTISKNWSKQSITCCLYNEDLNEIVTAGVGNVCTWRFYFGCRELMCTSTVTKGLTQLDIFTELALERAPVRSLALSRTQRCYAVCGKGVAVIDLVKATLLSYEKDLHNRKITGITLVENLRCVATSSRDGNIKIWDENWNLQMVFVGHRGPVTALVIYPHGPYLLSASEDETLRVWSLELSDKVDEIHMGTTITRLGTKIGEDSIFSCANQRLDLWTIKHLYKQHTSVGYTVMVLKASTIGPASLFPMRAACSCADGTARLVSPHTGDIITTLLLEKGQQAMDLDYCLSREVLLVLTNQGDLLKANSLTNPMSVRWKVPASTQASQFCCFCIYKHTVDRELTHSRWLQAVDGGSEEKIRILGVKDNDRNLPIAGHLNGVSSTLHWRAGNEEKVDNLLKCKFLLELTVRLPVTGEDNTIKVWRVFPYAQESLSLLMNFYSAHSATHLCIIKSLFVAALQNPTCAVHAIVLYDLRKKIRKDHHPDDDHKNEITGLCACAELKIFASASKGGSLKIWDHNNQLLRIIHLKAVANCISFCNDVGSLLLGIERNLYLMANVEYLTQQHLLRIACRDVSDPVSDVTVPISSTVLESLSVENSQRLRGPRSFKSTEHPVAVSEEPDEASMKKQEELKQGYALLAARDKEILLIQRGELRRKRKPARTKEIREEGFRKYMELFYAPMPKMEFPELKDFDSSEQLTDGKQISPHRYRCTNVVKGFFPPLTMPEPWDEITNPEKQVSINMEPSKHLARHLRTFIWSGPPHLQCEYLTERVIHDLLSIADLHSESTLRSSSEMQLVSSCNWTHFLHMWSPETTEVFMICHIGQEEHIKHNKQERDFIRAALWALKELMPTSQQLLVELMAQYLQSDILLKNAIKLFFTELGLLDPHNYFETELSSWMDFEKASDSTKEKLLNFSNKWNRKWTRKFKIHIREAMKLLRKGKTLRGAVTVPQSVSPAGRNRAVLPEAPSKATTIMIPERFRPGSLAEVYPIEVVNYFCETQLQKDLEEMVTQGEDAEKSKSERSKSKNTVFFLHKEQRERAILRLGETSLTETAFDKFHLPPIAPGSLSFDIGRVIKLAVPKINLNPFPSNIDRYPLDQVLITLRHSAQKYFILERSHVASYA